MGLRALDRFPVNLAPLGRQTLFEGRAGENASGRPIRPQAIEG